MIPNRRWKPDLTWWKSNSSAGTLRYNSFRCCHSITTSRSKCQWNVSMSSENIYSRRWLKNIRIKICYYEFCQDEMKRGKEMRTRRVRYFLFFLLPFSFIESEWEREREKKTEERTIGTIASSFSPTMIIFRGDELFVKIRLALFLSFILLSRLVSIQTLKNPITLNDHMHLGYHPAISLSRAPDDKIRETNIELMIVFLDEEGFLVRIFARQRTRFS